MDKEQSTVDELLVNAPTLEYDWRSSLLQVEQIEVRGGKECEVVYCRVRGCLRVAVVSVLTSLEL